MMNVGIIFDAARATGDEDLLRIATEHCLTTRRHLVRGDGSTAHEAIFDLETGEFLRNGTHQGWRRRFVVGARAGVGAVRVRDRLRPLRRRTLPRHRGALRRLLPRSHRRRHRAAQRLGGAGSAASLRISAAAIAASGLWQLAGLTADRERAARYRDATLAILTRLCSPEFLAVDDPAGRGSSRHGVYHERRGLGVDESVMWGDYFFVEALDRVLESTREGRP